MKRTLSNAIDKLKHLKSRPRPARRDWWPALEDDEFPRFSDAWPYRWH